MRRCALAEVYLEDATPSALRLERTLVVER
jgi:hypothetical protein